jgi:hypothetical protein
MLVAMMTCQRPNNVDYRPDSLDSLFAAGFKGVMMARDGFSTAKELRPRMGIVPTFRHTLAAGFNCGGSGPFVIFQDDIQPSSDMMTFSLKTEDGTDIQQRMKPSDSLSVIVQKCLPSERGVFSLYLTEGRDAPQGWSTIDKSDEYPLNVGACGVVMDAETARLFIESPPFPRVDRLGSQLVLWCWEKGIPFWIHSPSLLRHTGTISCRA